MTERARRVMRTIWTWTAIWHKAGIVAADKMLTRCDDTERGPELAPEHDQRAQSVTESS